MHTSAKQQKNTYLHPPFLPTVYSLPGKRAYRLTPAVREQTWVD